MATTVEVSIRGGHVNDRSTLAAFRSSAEIVQQYLLRAGCDGEYFIIPREMTRWKPKSGKRICLRPRNGADVRLRVKPSDNGSCWEYSLMGKCVNMDFVWENLEKVLGPEETNGDHEVVAQPAIPAALALVPGPDDALSKLSRLTAAVQKRKERQKEVSQLRDQLAEFDKKIKAIQDERAGVELELEELLKLDASDKDAKMADQLVALMNSL